MKKHLILIMACTAFLQLAAQSDTTIIYLNNAEEVTYENTASRYAVITKENGYWKKVVYNNFDNTPYWGAHFKDAACTFYNGPYSEFYPEGQPKTIGRYTDNKKTGLWKGLSKDGKLLDSINYVDGFIMGVAIKKYESGSMMDSLDFQAGGNGSAKGFWSDGVIREQGSYKDGKKQGLWTYYYTSGIKCQEVNYFEDSAISYTCYDENGLVQTTNCQYEKEALYKGGDKAWLGYLSKMLSTAKLPDAYYAGLMYGTVMVRFVVTKEGKTSDFVIVKSVNPELDAVAIRIIRQSPKWEPAIQYNRKVKAYRLQPITFSKVEE